MLLLYTGVRENLTLGRPRRSSSQPSKCSGQQNMWFEAQRSQLIGKIPVDNFVYMSDNVCFFNRKWRSMTNYSITSGPKSSSIASIFICHHHTLRQAIDIATLAYSMHTFSHWRWTVLYEYSLRNDLQLQQQNANAIIIIMT